MANFVLIYTGGNGMGASEEEQQKIMAEWGAWYGKMGEAVVDGGTPFGASKTVGSNGGGSATGYTIISAESLDDAVAKCADHPHISHGGDVTVYETIDMNGA